MDTNELALFEQAKNSGTPLKIFLDSGIGLTTPILDFDDTAMIVNDRDGDAMCVALDSVCTIRF